MGEKYRGALQPTNRKRSRKEKKNLKNQLQFQYTKRNIHCEKKFNVFSLKQKQNQKQRKKHFLYFDNVLLLHILKYFCSSNMKSRYFAFVLSRDKHKLRWFFQAHDYIRSVILMVSLETLVWLEII